MSVPPNSLAPAQTSSAAMIRVLGLVAMISGLLIVTAYEATKGTIADYNRQQLELAVRQVIPGAATIRTYAVVGDSVRLAKAGDKNRFYAGYDHNGRLLGLAGKAAAPGYADLIILLYGYNPKCQCITGLSVLQDHDTPGFGTKVATDSEFLANFTALDARLKPDDSAVAHPIVTVKHGTKRHPWQIDAISGATISSTAVGTALRRGTGSLLPVLMRHLAQIEAQR